MSRSRRVAVVIRCATVDRGVAPERCAGTVELRTKSGRIARARFDIPTAATRTVTLRISRKAFRKRRLAATLRAIVGQQAASKRVILRRRAA